MRVFISYSSGDREQIRPIVERIAKLGVELWWDQHLTHGSWANVIEDELKRCDYVFGFLTPNAANAKRDYIFAELDYAREYNKLIPFVIGNGNRMFAYRGLTATIQCYYFDDLESIADSDKLRLVIQRCAGQPQIGHTISIEAPKTAIERINVWYSDLEQSLDLPAQEYSLSAALTVALFEGASFSRIESFAQRLARVKQKNEKSSEFVLPSTIPQRRSKFLQLLKAHVQQAEFASPFSDSDNVVFDDSEWAIALVQFTWTEFSRWRGMIADWITEIVHGLNSDELMRLGFALGVLAQKYFNEVNDWFFVSWINSDNQRLNFMADAALSVAVSEPEVSKKIRQIILDWAVSNEESRCKIAVRLACGFVGARIPSLSIEVLEKLADTSTTVIANLLDEMQSAIKTLFELHSQENTDSLFDLFTLVSKLEMWILRDDAKRVDCRKFMENPYPILFFLMAINGIGISQNNKHGRSRFTLDSLVSNGEIRQSTARLINFALQRPNVKRLAIRRFAQDILKRWVNEVACHDTDHSKREILLKLGREMVRIADSENDRQRNFHLFAKIFSSAELTSIDPNGSLNIE